MGSIMKDHRRRTRDAHIEPLNCHDLVLVVKNNYPTLTPMKRDLCLKSRLSSKQNTSHSNKFMPSHLSRGDLTTKHRSSESSRSFNARELCPAACIHRSCARKEYTHAIFAFACARPSRTPCHAVATKEIGQ